MLNANKTHSSAGFYRPDIDGMRAMAVCLVIAAHLHLRGLGGGFVGVDIFFVISGYLISAILLRQLGNNTFSIVEFYERRVRRIIPALFVMLLFTCSVAWFLMLPTDLMDFAQSLVAAMLSISNIYFARQSSYFDLFANRRPLLHTWSLGVEEQFYLVFPLLLYLLFRYARAWTSRVIFLVLAVSFVACAVLVYRDPTSTFYLAPTRAWELLIGTVLAMDSISLARSRVLRETAGGLGLICILTATNRFANGADYPGFHALLPCAGAALVILGGQMRDSLSYRLLSWKPIVFIGTISYSLYLWHWPLIALRNYDFRESWQLSQASTDILIIAESFVAAVLSWRFVETPFRKGLGVGRRAVFSMAGVAAVSVLAFGSYVIASNGATSRYSPQSARIASYQMMGGDHASYRVNQCFILPRQGSTFLRDFDPDVCLPQSSTKPTYMIVGNSHAAHLWFGLSTVFTDINWQQVTGIACLPKVNEKLEGKSCREMRNFLLKTYLPSHHVDAILLSANWESSDAHDLETVLEELAPFHVQVFVIGPIMRYDRPLPSILVKESERGEHDGRSADAHLAPDVFEADATLKAVVRDRPGVRYISLIDLLCPRRQCVALTPGSAPMLADDSHVTRPGSVFLAQQLQRSGALQLNVKKP